MKPAPFRRIIVEAARLGRRIAVNNNGGVFDRLNAPAEAWSCQAEAVSSDKPPNAQGLVLARPGLSAELKISQRAALDLVAELAVREVTGRGRYRAWGIV
ncbi:hypothetical protein IHQ72_35725 (plasmid) [Mesorhizobium onobrychidis]|uniref:HTH DNA binding domain-containing protein n=1 Tax=Mesorhizobium onobrychidis TaxID=2775404 RepID=A0ABY5R7Y1_9HYPH|nr:hypothetical protein IHQ72_35725 [Mesorhizobium onobrychidis]